MRNPSVAPSERIFTPETVCVPATGVYIARSFDLTVPATKAEVLALAVDMGAPNGIGANFTKLAAGMQKRYGLVGTVVEGAAAAQAAALAMAARQECVIGVAGDQLNLTPHYQGNHVAHAICVLFPMGPAGVQLDPLAPAGYLGDLFSPAEMRAFATAAIMFPAPPDCSALEAAARKGGINDAAKAAAAVK